MEERNFWLLCKTFVDNARLAREQYDRIMEMREEFLRTHQDLMQLTHETHRMLDDVNKFAKVYGVEPMRRR